MFADFATWEYSGTGSLRACDLEDPDEYKFTSCAGAQELYRIIRSRKAASAVACRQCTAVNPLSILILSRPSVRS